MNDKFQSNGIMEGISEFVKGHNAVVLVSHPNGYNARSERKDKNVCYSCRLRKKNGKKFPSG